MHLKKKSVREEHFNMPGVQPGYEPPGTAVTISSRTTAETCVLTAFGSLGHLHSTACLYLWRPWGRLAAMGVQGLALPLASERLG